jgi:hypothetical protein
VSMESGKRRKSDFSVNLCERKHRNRHMGRISNNFNSESNGRYQCFLDGQKENTYFIPDRIGYCDAWIDY